MEGTIESPDDAGLHRESEGGSRRTLEAQLADGYRAGRLTKPDLRRLLGFETGEQIDSFLKSYGVYEPYTIEELELEISGVERRGF